MSVTQLDLAATRAVREATASGDLCPWNGVEYRCDDEGGPGCRCARVARAVLRLLEDEEAEGR